MDDRYILAEIERSLARDDPDHAARMTKLSRDLDQPKPWPQLRRHSGRRDAFIPIMVVVMFIVAIAMLLAVSAVQQPTTPGPTSNSPSVSEPVPGR